MNAPNKQAEWEFSPPELVRRILVDRQVTDGGITFELRRTKDARAWMGWRDQWGEHRESLAATLDWMLEPAHVVTWWEKIAVTDEATAECPLACGRAIRTNYLEGTWDACEHFAGEHFGQAVFAAARDLVRDCPNCDSYTPADGECLHCGVPE
jgi:hypothetical protein